jgi:predicted acyl esterase
LVSLERDVEMRTSDGVSLFADVYRPGTAQPLPVLLVRLPYDKRTGAMFHYAPPQWYAQHGYLVVLQCTAGLTSAGSNSQQR